MDGMALHRRNYRHAEYGTAAQAIRWSTVLAVTAVALVAGWVSYLHAYDVVAAHGEHGILGRLYPGTIDGLIYAASMVLLDAARRRVKAPPLARWLLTGGIAATLFANMLAGAAYGPLGVAVAAWPALALVGSYELLMYLVRHGAADAMTEATLEADAMARAAEGAIATEAMTEATAGATAEAIEAAMAPAVEAAAEEAIEATMTEAAAEAISQPWETPQREPQRTPARKPRLKTTRPNEDPDAKKARAEYRKSVQQGQPISDRALGAKYGRGRTWGRNRIDEVEAGPSLAAAGGDN